jgi:hypothetical protein
LDINQNPGSRVAAVANAGNDVVVTILGGDNVERVPAAVGVINTPDLLAGSVTVLQAPFPKTFKLDLATNAIPLILNKGYKLQDIKIDSTFGVAPPVAPAPAVKINHPTAGLASVDVKCDPGAGNQVFCVEVAGGGFHILPDVRVDVKDTSAVNVGILNNDVNVDLTIVGGRVRPTANASPITLIDSQGVLTVRGLEVDMTNAGHSQASTGIVLRAAGSLVTNSTIKVCNNAAATGIDVKATASPSTVKGNTFIGPGAPNGIGVKGGANLLFNALLNNTFVGGFGVEVQ